MGLGPTSRPIQSSFPARFTTWACQPSLSVVPEAQTAARLSLVDTYACMKVGAAERQSVVTAQALNASGDGGLVLPVGGGERRSLYGAAILNGVRSHAIDFDDYEIAGSTHVSAPLFSALLALSQPQTLSLSDVCNAWIVGFEAIVWIGTALGYGHYEKGWHSTATLGPIGVAAACARALQLGPEQMAHAMAIATSSSAGMKAQFGSDAKALHVGLAAESGLRAAVLAQAGVTGNTDLWDATQGLQELYGTPSSPGFQAMLEQMREGEALQQFPVVRKFWPSCSYTHRIIACAQVLADAVPEARAIERITLRQPEPFHRVSGFGTPTTSNEARFSSVYCAVVALLEGQVVPEDFLIERFARPERQRLCGRVDLDLYALPKVPPDQLLALTPERMTVRLLDGRLITHETALLPGSAAKPMTEHDVLNKVEDCGGSRTALASLLSAPEGSRLEEFGLFAA